MKNKVKCDSPYLLVHKDGDNYYWQSINFNNSECPVSDFADYGLENFVASLEWFSENFYCSGPWNLIIHEEEDGKESYRTIRDIDKFINDEEV